MSYKIWGRWKETMSTTWDTDWNNYSVADYCVMKD